MKTLLFVAAALALWAVNARASDAYSDPGEYRAPGITMSSSAATFTAPDTTFNPGTTYAPSAMMATAPDTTFNPGTTLPTSPSQTALQTAR